MPPPSFLVLALFSRHKATGMIDVVSRRCQHPQCVRRPLYAMAGQRAMFCRTHKDPDHTDVVSRRCSFEVSTNDMRNALGGRLVWYVTFFSWPAEYCRRTTVFVVTAKNA